jgi:hypothetical protein
LGLGRAPVRTLRTHSLISFETCCNLTLADRENRIHTSVITDGGRFVGNTELCEQATLERAAFRSALARPEHRQLFDYWESLCGENGLPSRSAFSPHHVRRLLPAISLIDVTDPLMQSTVRLAGTKLRELYGREITGLPLSDVIDCSDRSQAFGRAVEAGEPQHGKTPTDSGFQHWLKLPLCGNSDKVAMVLCLDVYESMYENRTEKKLAMA